MIFLHDQIYERLRGAIMTGSLPRGEKLTATRSLAKQLGVSRGTVETAFLRLRGEGYVVSRGKAGTFVTSAPIQLDTRPAAAIPDGSDKQVGSERPLIRPEFAVGVPATDLFPRKLWSTIAGRQARRIAALQTLPFDRNDVPELKEQICKYLRIARGFECRPAQVFMTGGYQGASTLVARALCRSGQAAIVEDPGYVPGYRALTQAGLKLAHVPVDADGMRIDLIDQIAPHAKLVVVAPANSFPLGVPLTLSRRIGLLNWARRTDSVILEDDYDGEFCYDGKPLPALKSLDRDDRVIYVGTFSKTLFHSLRVGYAIVPASRVSEVRCLEEDVGLSRPAFEYGTIMEFMRDGHFARHIGRMRNAYRERRRAVATELVDQLEDVMDIEVMSRGLHAVGWLKGGQDDAALRQKAAQAGYHLFSVSELSHAPQRPGLVLGLTNIKPENAPGAVKTFRKTVF